MQYPGKLLSWVMVTVWWCFTSRHMRCLWSPLYRPLIVTDWCSSCSVCFSIMPWEMHWVQGTWTRVWVILYCPCCWCWCVFSGCIAVCWDSNSIFVTDLEDGIDQYKLPNMQRSRTYSHEIISNVPLQVTTANCGEWLICGGDNRFVRVFDRWSGKFMEKLGHAKGAPTLNTLMSSHLIHFLTAKTLMQTVTVSNGIMNFDVDSTL